MVVIVNKKGKKIGTCQQTRGACNIGTDTTRFQQKRPGRSGKKNGLRGGFHTTSAPVDERTELSDAEQAKRAEALRLAQQQG